MVLKSVGLLSAGKIGGVTCAIIGFVIGGMMTLFSLIGAAVGMQAQGNAPVLPFMALGAAAILVIPIFYGFFGFIMGIIYAAVYNVVASFVGGLELEFESPRAPVA